MVILLGVVQTRAGNYQFNHQSDTAEEVLFPYQVLNADRVNVLVKDYSYLDGPVHRREALRKEVVRKNIDLVGG